MTIVEKILESGIEGSAILLLCAIAYKIFRMKIETEATSDCCKSCFKLHVTTSNEGNSNIPSV